MSLIPSDNVGVARAVAASYIWPADIDPLRFGDIYSTDPTAVTRVLTRNKVYWPAGGTNTAAYANDDYQMQANDWGMFVFPNLFRHIVQYTVWNGSTAVPPTASFSYFWCFDLSTSETQEAVTGGSVVDVNAVAALGSPGLTQPHGNVLFAGQGGGRKGIYIDGGTVGNSTSSQLNFQFTTFLPNTSTLLITVYRWHAGNWDVEADFLFTVPNTTTNLVTVPIVQSGYYSATVDMSGVATSYASSFIVFHTTRNPTTWAHLPAANVANNLVNVDEYRVSGLAVLYQNQASVLNQQGNLLLMQINGNVAWYDGLANGPLGGTNGQLYLTLFNMRDAKSKLLAEGGYIWRKPKSSVEFDFKNEVQRVSLYGWYANSAVTELNVSPGINTCAQACWSLDNKEDYLALAASSNQLSAGDGIISVGMGVEYNTENTWIPTEIPRIPKQLYELGVSLLKDEPQVTSNFSHWPELLDSLSAAATTLAPVAQFIPAVGPAISAGLMIGGPALATIRRVVYGAPKPLLTFDEDDELNPQAEDAKRIVQAETQALVPVAQVQELEARRNSRNRKRPAGETVGTGLVIKARRNNDRYLA